MTRINENPRATACVISPANGDRSFQQVIIEAGAGVLMANTVISAGATAGEFKPAADGETPLGICMYEVDATTNSVAVNAVVRDCTVNIHELQFDATVDDDTKKEAMISGLGLVGIIGR